MGNFFGIVIVLILLFSMLYYRDRIGALLLAAIIALANFLAARIEHFFIHLRQPKTYYVPSQQPSNATPSVPPVQTVGETKMDNELPMSMYPPMEQPR